ncbi:PREDICTED: histone H1-like [Nicotiana attenuata]|uniref:histone H1-like n=1 Tax=Nicotiana attenuata TaxID=49451 RepID=UPI000905241E|nr:PREDICTED: histone H1-like [Nicotiana attenuata]
MTSTTAKKTSAPKKPGSRPPYASNFRKLLLVRMKKLVAYGKLTKLKGSFKLASTATEPAAPVKPKKGVAAGVLV